MTYFVKEKNARMRFCDNIMKLLKLFASEILINYPCSNNKLSMATFGIYTTHQRQMNFKFHLIFSHARMCLQSLSPPQKCR